MISNSHSSQKKTTNKLTTHSMISDEVQMKILAMGFTLRQSDNSNEPQNHCLTFAFAF